MKISANGYITIVILAGFALIGYSFTATPATAPDRMPLILAGIGALIVLIRQQADVVAKVATTDAKVEHSIVVSQENASAIAAVAVQQAQALEGVSQQLGDNTALTETTHKIVNSQRTDMLNELAAMRQEIAEMKQARAAEATSESRIIAAVEGKAAP